MNKILTREQLVELLHQKKGATFVTITTVTIPKLLKEGNPLYKKVEKIARRNGITGASYQQCVRNRQEKEGLEPNFEAEPLPWGEHDGPYLVKHKGKYYLKYRASDNNLEEVFRRIDNREIISKDLVTPFYPVKTSRQGVEKPVGWITPSIENIRQISIFGESFELV